MAAREWAGSSTAWNNWSNKSQTADAKPALMEPTSSSAIRSSRSWFSRVILMRFAQANDTGLDHQPRAAPSQLNPCIQGFEVGVNCAAAAAIMALAGKISAQGHYVAAVARAFWPRRSSSNRGWLAHEIVQQPVKLFLPKSEKVLELPDSIGCLQFFAF
jgi:hypothetical protein